MRIKAKKDTKVHIHNGISASEDFFCEIPHPATSLPLRQGDFFYRIQVDKSFVVIESFDSGMARCAKFKDFIRRGIFLY